MAAMAAILLRCPDLAPTPIGWWWRAVGPWSHFTLPCARRAGKGSQRCMHVRFVHSDMFRRVFMDAFALISEPVPKGWRLASNAGHGGRAWRAGRKGAARRTRNASARRGRWSGAARGMVPG